MYDYFKSIVQKTVCNSRGVCSIHPSVSSLHEVLMNEIREIAFYVVKLKEFNLTDKKVMDFAIYALSIFMINTSFNEKKYLDLILNLYNEKIETKNKYLHYCSENQYPCEIINSDYEINEKTTINDLIKHSEIISANNQKNYDKTKQELFEIIKLCAKLCAVYIIKIKKINKSFDAYDYELMRFVALINGFSIRNEKITRRIHEFSSIIYEIREILFKTYHQHYGDKETAHINTSLSKGHSILVSGSDLDELEILLSMLENYNDKEINVYTNGALILAHTFSYFKHNKFLKGHIDSGDIERDFSGFQGSILITQNFVNKIDNIYRGELFSNKIISFTKMNDVENNNFVPLIETSLRIPKNIKSENETFLDIDYNAGIIDELLENFYNDEIIIIVGSLLQEKHIVKYKDKKILYLNCLCEADILTYIIEYMQKKQAKIILFFPQCDMESLGTLFSMLNQNVELYFADCSYNLVNPHVMDGLKHSFNVKIVD